MNVSMILSQASYFQKLQPASKLASSQVVATFTSLARLAIPDPTKIHERSPQIVERQTTTRASQSTASS